MTIKKFFQTIKKFNKKQKAAIILLTIVLIALIIFEFYAMKRIIIELTTKDINLLFFILLLLIYCFAQLYVLNQNILDKIRQLSLLMTNGNFTATKKNHRITIQNTKNTYSQKLEGFEFISIASYCVKLIMSLSTILLLFMFHFLLMYSNIEITNQHAIYLLIYSMIAVFLIFWSMIIIPWYLITSDVIIILDYSFFRKKKINKLLKKYNK